MSTFSQIVDRVVERQGRADLLDYAARLTNLTVRELFFTDRNTPAYYDSARVETQLTATTELGYVWDLPNPYTFQALETARFDSIRDSDGRIVYAEEVTPGRIVNDKLWFYYRTGDSIAFAGYGGINATISVSYFEYANSLKYYPAGPTRPAEVNELGQWTYQSPYDVDANSQAQAQALTSHWLLRKWSDVIEEGVHAKLYKAKSDEARAKLSFSLFQNFREALYRAESIQALRN